ncbi:MAG: hypothetical protein ACI4QT_07100 [Kiritimatiellia bacterium]
MSDIQAMIADAIKSSDQWDTELCPVILADSLSTATRIAEGLQRSCGMVAVVSRPRLRYAGATSDGACAWDVEDARVEVYESGAVRSSGDSPTTNCYDLALLAADIVQASAGFYLSPSSIDDASDDESGIAVARVFFQTTIST